MRKSAILLCLIHVSLLTSGQVRTVDFEQIKELQQAEKRPILVFIQTDWCKYCHQMKSTFKTSAEIATVLNEKFYVVFLNAEDRRTINYSGRTFKFKPTGANVGVHELAQALGTIEGSLSYPTLCFLNEQDEIIYQYGGFLDSKSFLKTLKAISHNFDSR